MYAHWLMRGRLLRWRLLTRFIDARMSIIFAVNFIIMMTIPNNIWPVVTCRSTQHLTLNNKQGSFVTGVLSAASILVATLTLTHDLQNVLSSSNRGTEYLYKIWLKSFNPFPSYCSHKFLHVTLVWPWHWKLITFMKRICHTIYHKTIWFWYFRPIRRYGVIFFTSDLVVTLTLTLQPSKQEKHQPPIISTYKQSFNFISVVFPEISFD